MLNSVKVVTFSNNFTLNFNLFILLAIGHVIGDYLLQTGWQAENKGKLWRALLLHSFIYTLSVFLITIISGGISLISIAIIFISHILIDKGFIVKWWMKNVKKENPENWSIRFLVDQSLHLLILTAVTLIN